MSKKQKSTPSLNIEKSRDESDGEALARSAVQPEIQGAMTLREYTSHGMGDDLDGLVKTLGTQVDAANKGDFTRPEALLSVQAHALDAIFHKLARCSANAQYMDSMDRYLRLALKAQSQCRTTLEALAEMKAPKAVAFVRQANIAHGHQQVNNGANARARETDSMKSKQLEAHNGERLDTGAQSTAVGDDPAVATVGAGNRTKKRRG